jgi:hypothetical protein
MRPNGAAAVSGAPKCGLEHWHEGGVERLRRQVEIGDVSGGRVQPAAEINDSGGLLVRQRLVRSAIEPALDHAGLPAQVLT